MNLLQNGIFLLQKNEGFLNTWFLDTLWAVFGPESVDQLI